MGTFYISPKGNDTGAGTESAPWRSLWAAASRVNAGDIGILLPGTYTEQLVPKSGTTWKGIELGKAILQGSGAEDVFGIHIKFAQNVNVADLVLRDWHVNCYVNDSTGIYAEGLQLYNSRGCGIELVKSASLTFFHCLVDGAGSIPDHRDDCLRANETRNLAIVYCEFARGGHSGVILLDATGTGYVIRKCRFRDMGGSLLTLYRSVNDALIEDNWFEGAPTREQMRQKSPSAHGGVPQPHHAVQMHGHGHIFRRNIVCQCGAGIRMSSNNAGEHCIGCLIQNNTFHDFEDACIEFVHTSDARPESLTGNILEGNIFSQAGKNLLAVALVGGGKTILPMWDNIIRKNFFGPGNNNWAGSGGEIHDAEARWPTALYSNRSGDPEFVDAANGDFRVKPGSRAGGFGALMGSSIPPPPPPPSDLSVFRQRALVATNAKRAMHNLNPVILNDKLNQAAQAHSEDRLAMIPALPPEEKIISHIGSDGSTIAKRAKRAGYVGTVWENGTAGPHTPEAAVENWYKSPDHKENLLRQDVADMGLGCAPVQLSPQLWFAEYGRPSGSPLSDTVPEILSISPTSGPIGTEVEIRGKNLGTEGQQVVVFGLNALATSVRGKILSAENEIIRVRVEDGSQSGAVYVQRLDLPDQPRSNGLQFAVTPPEAPPPPVGNAPELTSATPLRVARGAVLVLRGQNFGREWGEVTIGMGFCEVLAWGPTYIAGKVPIQGTSGAVTVVRPGGLRSNTRFVVVLSRFVP